MKLYCCTFAGGTASFYNELEKKLAPDIEVKKLEYAGHGERRKEPFCESLQEIGVDLYNFIKQEKPEEYALIGYSMGSIAVVEILRNILLFNEISYPKYIFLAAHEPCTKMELPIHNDMELDDFVKLRTIKFGGVPENLIENKSFWRVYLPIYRADYLMIEKYKFEELKIRSTIPTTVFYSEEDTPIVEMQKWKNYFVGICDFIEYEGGHFFIYKYMEEMAKEIKKRLVM